MRVKYLGFVITALVASIAPGQRPAEQSLDRVFNLTHIEAPQDLQEIATAIRVMTDSRQVSTDDQRKSLALQGTPVQIALAEWLLSKPDQPANRQAVAQQGQGSAPHEYRLPGNADDVARVFYLTHIETPQNLLEVATTARTIGEIRRLLPYSALRAVILRGTAGQVALAEWLLNELDKPANRRALAQQKQGSAVHEYRLSGSADSVARVFYLTHIETPQDLVELATAVRTIGDIRRLYSHNALGAVILRGAADQVALAEWLFNELDKPANR